MKAARLSKPGASLYVEEVAALEASGTEVILSVECAGICHSDLHLRDGEYDLGSLGKLQVRDRGVCFPMTPGHEIVGRVARMGAEARGLQAKERVLLYPWIGCQLCEVCAQGEYHLCEQPQSVGIYRDGGYAEEVKVPHSRYLLPIGDLDPILASSLACSGLSAYSALQKANLKAGEKLLIIGAGGLGLMAIQLACHLTRAEITCLDTDPAKLARAQELGAHHQSTSMNLESRFDAVIDFVNSPQTVEMALTTLRKQGRLILVGFFGGSALVSLPLLPMKALSILGSYTGSLRDLRELVVLAQQGHLRSVVCRQYSLEEAQEALDDLAAGNILGRGVIVI